MYIIQVHYRISQLISAFYRLGLWNDEIENSTYKARRKLFYLIFFILFVMMIGMGSFVCESRDESIFLALVTTTGVVLIARLFALIRKKKEILLFTREFGVYSIKDYEEFMQVNKKLKNFVQFLCYFAVAIFVGILLLLLLPVFTSARDLPLNIWFPLDYKNDDVVYWIAYAFVSCGSVLAYVCMSQNALVWYVMFNCAIKYEILGNQLKHLGEAAAQETIGQKSKISEAEEQNLYLRDFIVVIKTHQSLQEYFCLDLLKYP